MTDILGPHRYYSLERDTDVSGKSGTGTVAYAIELGGDHVLMLWDTEFEVNGFIRHSAGIEILDDLDMLREIHCYNGKTRLEPIVDPAKQQRVQELLDMAQPRLARVNDLLLPGLAVAEDAEQ